MPYDPYNPEIDPYSDDAEPTDADPRPSCVACEVQGTRCVACLYDDAIHDGLAAPIPIEPETPDNWVVLGWALQVTGEGATVTAALPTKMAHLPRDEARALVGALLDGVLVAATLRGLWNRPSDDDGGMFAALAAELVQWDVPDTEPPSLGRGGAKGPPVTVIDAGERGGNGGRVWFEGDVGVCLRLAAFVVHAVQRCNGRGSDMSPSRGLAQTFHIQSVPPAPEAPTWGGVTADA